MPEAERMARRGAGGGGDRSTTVVRGVAALGAALLMMGACGVAARNPAATIRGIGVAIIAVEGGRYEGVSGVVLQRETWDCGPAALASLATHLGILAPDLRELGMRAGTTHAGTSLGGLVRAARTLGISGRAVRIDSLRRATVPLPMVAWVRQGHFVAVVDRTADDRVVVLDPQVGRYSLPASAFLRIWSGEALVLDQ